MSDVATNLLQEHKFPNADEKKRKINLVKADIGKCCKGNKRHLNDGCLYCYKDENLWNRIKNPNNINSRYHTVYFI